MESKIVLMIVQAYLEVQHRIELVAQILMLMAIQTRMPLGL